MINFTQEQQRVVDCAVDGQNLSVNAGPGSGKTTVGRRVANNLPSNRGAYIAFNESTAKSAKNKFPNNFKVMTSNALAFAQMRNFLNGRDIKNLNGYQTSSILDLSPMPFGSPSTYGFYINQTLFNYCNSAERNITIEHVPELGNEDKSVEYKSLIAQNATDLFVKICKAEGQLPVGHNIYMKLWQLSDPKLNLDTLILDEAQDTNPVLWDVLSNQRDTQLILLGDQYQQINAWRGGMNVMDKLNDCQSLNLTKSFRFGPNVAAVANCILAEHFASHFRLVGNENIDSKLERIKGVSYDLNLYRTNAGMITDLLDAVGEGKKAYINGDIKELKGLVNQCSNLKQGKNVTSGEFSAFKSWDDAVDYSKTPAGSHLRKIFGMVNNHSSSHLIQALDSASNVRLADSEIVFSTVHRAKGMEANAVRVGGDFISPADKKWTPSESNLLYVAVTRAQKYLDETLVREIIQTPSKESLEFKQSLPSKLELAKVEVEKPSVIQDFNFDQLSIKPGMPF